MKARGSWGRVLVLTLTAGLCLSGAVGSPAGPRAANAAGTNLVADGGFEAPLATNSSTFDTYTAGHAPATFDWNVTGNSIDLIQGYWTPFSGAQSVDLDGAGPGGVSQSLSTTPGQSYVLSFAYSANPDRFTVAGCASTKPGASMTVTWGGVAIGSYTFAADNSNTAMGWRSVSLPLSGGATNSAQTVLAFSSTDVGSACGIALDDVSVIPVAGGPDNTAWTRATPISLDANGDGSTAASLDLPGQARWYKFDVSPGGRVQVDLTGLPANYDLAVFSDIGQAFNALSSPNDLQTVSAEFGNDAFSPSVFSPSVFSPSVFSPSVFSPSVFSPSVFSPSVFSPSVFSPSVFSPSVFSPDPQDYQGAQTRSLIAISAHDGTSSEQVSADVWNNTGSFYIRINGRDGTFDPGAQFAVSVHRDAGTCGGVAPSSAALLPSTPPAGGYQTLVLTDYPRMTDDGTLSTMESKVTSFDALASVHGATVDLESSPRVAALNAQADAHNDCAYAKNLVAGSIRDIVTAYRAQNQQLKYVVVVGNDHVIPFFRYPDTAGIGPESSYVPPVLDTSASQASLQSNDVLSQDAYGAATVLHLNGIDVPIPDLPVGRLVETPSEISGLLDAYSGLTGGVVPTPTSSLVTGYDFMASGAQSVESDFSAGLPGGSRNDSLITNQGVAPGDTGAPPTHSWTADQLRSALLGQRHDLVFLAGHFSANNTLAADYSTTMNSTELAASSVNLVNSIVFSAGCHSGYNIVNSDAVPAVTQPLDWTEAFAQKKATLIAGTGYQYGDTDFLAYSEQLYADFAHALRLGSGPVSVGDALMQAKQTYLDDTTSLRGIDVKSLLESTLYGLPMLSVDLPAAGRVPTTTSSSIVGSTTPFGTAPGSVLGLSSTDVTLSPTLTTHTVPFVDPNNNPGPTATYLSGPDGVDSSPGAPTLPVGSYNVTVPNVVLRGVGFRDGTYTDTSGITPLTGAPATELNSPHAAFISSAFYPGKLWTANYFGGLTGGGTTTDLKLTPAQYKSDQPGSLTDTQRSFSSVGLRLFYSGNTTPYGANTPALAAPPTIARVDASGSGGTVTFQIHVVGDPSAGIQQAWVTYAEVDPGRWESLDLTQDAVDSTLWTGALTGLSPGAVSGLRFMVQAVNGVGLVSLDDNQGSYYQPNQIPPALQVGGASLAQTTLQLDSPPSSGDYGTSIPVSGTLTGPGGTPIPGQVVSFTVGGSTLSGATNAAGVATVQLPLVDLPGAAYRLTAGFEGNTSDASSSASLSPFAINTLPTTLGLTGGGGTVLDGADTGISALLSGNGVGLSQRTVEFVLAPTGGGASVTQTRITDFNGRAKLGVVAHGLSGAYNVKAYFGPGAPITLPADPVYQPSSSGVSTLTVTGPAVTSINRAAASPTNAASVTWTVTFNESVSGVAAANFALAASGVSGAGGITVSGNGSTYTVSATTGSGSGTLGLNLSTGAGITDSVGGSPTAPVTGQVYTIDKAPPTITFNGNKGTYGLLDSVNITCTASDPAPASGVKTNPCTGFAITGPASSFKTGSNTLPSPGLVAVDNAGNNSAPATTSFTVTVTTSTLCTLTQQYVQTSPKYLALNAAQKAIVNALSSALCKTLAAIVPKLTPAQKAQLVAAYKTGVQALVSQGWLTAAQGTTLNNFASAL